MLVVYYHTLHAPSFGEFGVDVFFVLSGFVMGMLMARDTSPGLFMKRRLARIFPLYFLTTSAALAISWTFPFLRKSGETPTALNYILSLLFIPHHTAKGNLCPVLSVGWTLNYEMLFYAVCCIGLVCSYQHRIKVISATIILVAVLGAWVGPTSALGEFAGNKILLEFILGLLIWKIADSGRFEYSRHWPLVATAALWILMSIFHVTRPSAFMALDEWSRPAMYALPAALIVFLGFTGERSFMRLPESARAFMVRLGDSSYAIYLTHIFILGLINAVLPKLGLGGAATTQGMLIAVLVSAWFGVFVHEKLDDPIQRHFRKKLGI